MDFFQSYQHTLKQNATLWEFTVWVTPRQLDIHTNVPSFYFSLCWWCTQRSKQWVQPQPPQPGQGTLLPPGEDRVLSCPLLLSLETLHTAHHSTTCKYVHISHLHNYYEIHMDSWCNAQCIGHINIRIALPNVQYVFSDLSLVLFNYY